MMELKTMKDFIRIIEENGSEGFDTKVIYPEEIKEEAIKWHKYLKEIGEDNVNVFDFIETFFGVTEEDLERGGIKMFWKKKKEKEEKQTLPLINMREEFIQINEEEFDRLLENAGFVTIEKPTYTSVFNNNKGMKLRKNEVGYCDVEIINLSNYFPLSYSEYWKEPLIRRRIRFLLKRPKK